MPATPSLVEYWLPALPPLPPGHPLRVALCRADRLAPGAAGYMAGLGEHFAGVGDELAAGAITREFLAGDAGEAAWLCADPAWVEPDINGVRMMACGRMGLDADEAEALAQTLRPAFAEAGLQLELTTPERWHLRLSAATPLPALAAPERALGESLGEHLPGGPEGKFWRVLFTDLQILLHKHPVNQARAARRLSPVTGIWMWGGGRLPAPNATSLAGVVSDDTLLRALAARAGVPWQARGAEAAAAAGAGWLVDLQDLPFDVFERDWWPQLAARLATGGIQLHAASGERWRLKPWHRWRFWRRAGR